MTKLPSRLPRAGAVAIATLLVLTGCAPGADGERLASSVSTRACVILPDADSAPRWEQDDRPALKRSITDAGFTADIRNAEGATGSYEQQGDELLAGGCGVMILVDFDGAGAAVARKARAAGVPVVAYDRPLDGADYLVAFDHENAGRLQGEAIVASLEAAGKDPSASSVYFVGGAPTDASATMVRRGATSMMSGAGIVVTAAFDGTGDSQNTASRFATELDSKGGRVDAVWVMNDTDAAGVIQVLDARGIVVPVTGQDATLVGLRNVLRGAQTMTISRNFAEEARTAATIAIGLLFGNDLDPETDGFMGSTPYVKVPVERVGLAQLGQLTAAGVIDAAALCTGLEEACAANGISW